MNKRSWLQRPLPYEYKNVLFIIIGINVVMQIIQYAVPNIVYNYLALSPGGIFRGRIWQFVTYMFVHSTNISHLLFNMLALYFFGRQLERELGSWEFLLFYLSTGAVSGFLSFLLFLLTGSNVLLIGASGAVFGILLLFATFHPDARILIFFVFPVSAGIMILIYVAYELLMQFSNRNSNVSHITHLAGIAWAYLFIYVRYRMNPIKRLFPRYFS